jgi:polysaccharide pyruvyl transferase WcaK-like protein
MGPFHKIPNRLAARILLPRIKAIIARGDLTEKYLRELGLSNVYRGTDSAFALQTSDDDARSLAAKLDLDFFSGRDVVGFAPSIVLAKSAEKAGKDYIAESVDLINFITETLNLPIAIIPHSVRVGTEKTHNNDLPISRAIYARVSSPEKVFLVDAELTPRELRVLIGKCHIFIASRFHAMVSALAETVPTLVIGWSHKYGEVLADFEQRDFNLSLAEAKPQKLYPMVNDLLQRHDAVHQDLTRNSPKVRELALTQFALIEEIAAQR